MIKTIKIYKLGEEPEIDYWEKPYSIQERADFATELIYAAWRFAHNTPFPNMDRSIVKIIHASDNRQPTPIHNSQL